MKNPGDSRTGLLWQSTRNIPFISRVEPLHKLFHECQSAHEACRSKALPAPARLLEIVDKQHSGYRLRLTSPKTRGLALPYIALSYCWGIGETAPTKTSKSNVAQYSHDISWDLSAKTIQDAVTVTHALNFHHLWVDALCIIQDDLEDWQREAAKMADIFARSELTIIASSAEHSRGGLYLDSLLPPILVEPAEDFSGALIRWPIANFNELDKLRLYTRGWVFQEILLSSRRVHFQSGQFYWHCQCLVSSEDETHSYHGTIYLPSSQLDRKDWLEVIMEYNQKHFTFRADKLAALAGSMKWWQSRVDLTPILGLWRESLS
jgi:hypothetical protein